MPTYICFTMHNFTLLQILASPSKTIIDDDHSPLILIAQLRCQISQPADRHTVYADL